VSKGKLRNVTASVRERLRRLAEAQHEDFQLVLTRYGLERLLYRLSQSEHRDLFVLKGAMLFALWTEQRHRPTRDLDLLGRGPATVERCEEVFRAVCAVPVADDGLHFHPESVRGATIREDQHYEGVRLALLARLESARIPLQIDVGFGDAVTPGAVAMDYPTLLASPVPTVRAYPRETVVAEKYQALVLLGMSNSRLKDFYDLWVLSRQFSFEGPVLAAALAATFDRRRTPLPSAPPLALTAEFHGDKMKRQQWRAFLNKGKLAEGLELERVTGVLGHFLLPPTAALVAGRRFDRAWPAGGPWQSAD
jgi:hypothetical protein